MYVKGIEVKPLETDSDQEIALNIMKFWEYQAREAEISMAIAWSAPNNMVSANRQAVEVWRRDDDNMGFMGMSMPHSEAEIKAAQDRAEVEKAKYSEARKYADFVNKYFMERAFPDE